MVKLEEPRLRCRYYDAIAAIGLMKGMPMIDVACDDALISALMEMDAASVQNEVRVTRQPLVEDDATPFGGSPRKDVQVGDVCDANHTNQRL